MRLGRKQMDPSKSPHRAPEWRVKAWRKYYARVEAIVDKAVREGPYRFTRPPGSNRRRMATNWLRCDTADEMIREKGVG